MKENKGVEVKLEKANKIAHCLDALSSEKRMQIMFLLSKKEMNVGNVAQALKMPQSSVSSNLSKLFTCGWIIRRKQGKNVYYKINKKNTNNIIKLLNHYFIDKKSHEEAVLWHH